MRSSPNLLEPTKKLIYDETADALGQVYADRLHLSWQAEEDKQRSVRVLPLEHSSHSQATELLAPYRDTLGAAYPTLHFLARWSLEHASEDDPAPHLMTTYWTLEEALGLSERTLRRHLIEDGHLWSETVKHLIDVRHNFGEMLCGKDEQGRDKTKCVCVATVIRFFPKGRQSKQARVKCWGERDLLAEADAGRTRAHRLALVTDRYERRYPKVSAYTPVKNQGVENNWLLVKLGQTVSTRVAHSNNPGNLYADIPTSYLLHALREDLVLSVSGVRDRGANIKRARSLWVDMVAKCLAERFGDTKPLKTHNHPDFITHADGFTDLWRKAIWTALRAELYSHTEHGWNLLQRMINLAQDARAAPIDKPTAWAVIKQEGFAELLRDYDTGAVGALPLPDMI